MTSRINTMIAKLFPIGMPRDEGACHGYRIAGGPAPYNDPLGYLSNFKPFSGFWLDEGQGFGSFLPWPCLPDAMRLYHFTRLRWSHPRGVWESVRG